MRVLSANLQHGKVDPAWFRDLVTSTRADIVTIQEADARHYDALASELPHGQFAAGDKHSGMGISMRYPASFERVPLAWRDAHEAHLSPDDWPELLQPLRVTNLHVAAPHIHRPPFYGFLLRRKQVGQLERHFESRNGSQLLIGDFNATPIWPVYQRLAAMFTDAAIAVAQRKGGTVLPTWGRTDGRRLLRLDHAFTRGVEPCDFHVVALKGSDHSAIVLDLDV